MAKSDVSKSGVPLRLALAAGLMVCLLVVLGVYFTNTVVQQRDNVQAESTGLPRSRTVEVGGILRPASDVDSAIPDSHLAGKDRANLSAEEKQRLAPYPYGRTPRLVPAESSTVLATYEAITAGPKTASPEMFSPMLPAKEFNLASYQANPESYLSTVEPGRVWQAAQPAEGVPVIERISERTQEMRQGESVRLQIKTAPNAPVTFTSFDLGAFDNGMTSISVAATDTGIAEATFTGTPGSIAKAHIAAASPQVSGRVNFTVTILPRSE